MNSKEIIYQYWNAVNERNWEKFEFLVSDSIKYILPQTRELVTGVDDCREFNATYPGDWSIKINNVVSEDNKVISKITFLDEQGEQTSLSIFTIKNGKIVEMEEYWPAPYDPPKRNIEGIERY